MNFVHVFNVRELAVILILTCSFGNTQLINNVSPKIDTTKADIVVQSDENFSLRCEGKQRPVVWNYTLEPQELPNYYEHTYDILERSSTKSNTFNKPIDVPYKSELVVTGATYTDTGYFYCLYQGTTNYDDVRDVAKVYIYVNSSIHLLTYEHEATFALFGHETMPLEIPCKPTSPGVKVTLFKDNNVQLYPPKNPNRGEEEWKFNPYRGFYVDHATNSHSGLGYECRATAPYAKDVHELKFTVQIMQDHPGGLPKPVIQDASQGYATVGENVTFNCSVILYIGSLITVEWIQVSEAAIKEKRSTETTKRENTAWVQKRRFTRTLVIQNVRKTDEGNYTCMVSDRKSNESVTTFLKINEHNETYIKLSAISNITENATLSASWVVTIDANPNPETIWQKPNGDIVKQEARFQIRNERKSSMLNISDLSFDDAGVYTFIAKAGNINETRKFTLNVRDKPKVTFRNENSNILLVSKQFTLTCIIKAYPKATVVFLFRPCSPQWNCSNDFTKLNATNQEKLAEEKDSEYLPARHKVIGIANKSGEYRCLACNPECSHQTVKFKVSGVVDGFKLTGPGKNPVETTDVSLTCSVSLFMYQKSIKWLYTDQQGNETNLDGAYSSPGNLSRIVFFKGMTTDLSYEDILHFPNISKADSGSYKCRVVDVYTNKTYDSTPVHFTVLDIQAPEIVNRSYPDGIVTAYPGDEVVMTCQATGMPLPEAEWLKDEEEFSAFETDDATSVVNLKYVKPENAGTYECRFKNKAGSAQFTFTLTVEEHTPVRTGVIVGVVLAAIIFLGLLAVLLYKIYQEKQRASFYNVKSLDAFLSGDLSSINPDLPIDEQADLLPYDKRWEFPSDRLKLGKQLGSGAFGRVLKGEAMGICESEAVTVVAVKMVKTHANYSAFKALLSEVKIMIHLGSHLNVVNLLGACTKNFTKGELLVIVEYCRFGNIQNYLIRHRDEFTSQIDPISGTFDPIIGAQGYAVLAAAAANAAGLAEKDLARTTSRGPSSPGACSTISASSSTFPNESVSTGTTYVAGSAGLNYQVDSSGQLLGGLNSSGSQSQAPWRSNYKGDYRDTAGPLRTQDLLCWGFQIARGMEYLSSRKVLHGDLAARNILLAEDNIVKICDFGLAREVYKNGGNYKKKGDGPLPVKWMAVESISDLVFSTQSDVWSFGIVLWEIFSLGKTPYPDMQADELFYQKLQSGYHMECPKYATKDVYDVMVNCWQLDPRSRPSFTELQERLGGLLEASVRLQYINLNEPYVSLNEERRMEDYLDMIRQPDYANMASSPGPVDYANVPLPIDVDSQRISSYVTMSPSVLNTLNPADNQEMPVNTGYMFMSLPSNAEKTDNVIQEGKPTKFNFDFSSKSRKFDGKSSDALTTSTCESPLGIPETTDDTPVKLLPHDVVQHDSGLTSPSGKNPNLNSDPGIFRSPAMANTEPSYYNLKQMYSPK